ncbi:MAG: hypothetical protein IPO58_12050 [Betaproteobacteria bacterium]|nr:hypothetical protein [Betaproteobacteria bacterium]
MTSNDTLDVGIGLRPEGEHQRLDVGAFRRPGAADRQRPEQLQRPLLRLALAPDRRAVDQHRRRAQQADAHGPRPRLGQVVRRRELHEGHDAARGLRADAARERQRHRLRPEPGMQREYGRAAGPLDGGQQRFDRRAHRR